MINKKIILKILGFLLVGESLFIFLSFLVSLVYKEYDSKGLLISSIITTVTGLLALLLARNAKKEIGKREGYIIVSLAWIVFSLFGSLPFILSGGIPSFTDAFFETISGFTTTGSSILNNIEELPHGLLFWRSLTQWLGGMGIVVLTIAILPIFGIGGMQLFIAEVPGPTPDKLHPKIKETARNLWGIYVLFTFVETILLLFGGMNLFDSICHSFTTMATGGYSTKQASIAFYSSPYIQYVIIFFMFLAGTNFTLSYLALTNQFKKITQNTEFKSYVLFIGLFTAVIAVFLVINGEGVEKAFRDSLFQVVSIITTTGYVTADYLSWQPFLMICILLLMFFGGSSGSTGGGIKIIRIVILIKNSFLELKRLIHPNAVVPVRLNNKSVAPQIVTNVMAFFIIYIMIFAISVVIMAVMEPTLDSAIGAVATTLGNIGPGIGSVGPMDNFKHISVFGKWFLSFLMLLGRLELFTVLILLSPAFWRK